MPQGFFQFHVINNHFQTNTAYINEAGRSLSVCGLVQDRFFLIHFDIANVALCLGGHNYSWIYFLEKLNFSPSFSIDLVTVLPDKMRYSSKSVTHVM